MAILANEFSTENVVTSTGAICSFGWSATYVAVQNDKATPVYVSLGTTTPSTGGRRTCGTESFSVSGVQTAYLSLASTTTSTGTIVRVYAAGN